MKRGLDQFEIKIEKEDGTVLLAARVLEAERLLSPGFTESMKTEFA
jgi:hypothetical protein